MASKSSIAREFWRKIFNENSIDLRNADARKSVVRDFLNDPMNKKDGWNPKTDLRFFRLAFDKVSREFGKSTAEFGVKPEPKRVKTQAGKMNFSFKTDEKPLHQMKKQDAGEKEKEEKDKKELPKEFQSKELLKQQQAIASTYTANAVGTIFETVFNIVHSRFPACSKLSPAEKMSLGEAWYPIFNEYLSGENSKWILPAVITAPIVLVRVSEYQRVKQEEKIAQEYQMDFHDPSQQKKDASKDKKKKDDKPKWSDRL
jgi:hypothetical protein